MKSLKIIPVIVLITLSFGSCLHVFQPLFSDNQLIAPSGLTGKWMMGNDTMRIESFVQSDLSKMLDIQTGSSLKQADNNDTGNISVKSKMTFIMSYSSKNIKYYYSMQVGMLGSDYYAQVMPLLFIPDNDKTTEENSRYNAFWAQDIVSTYAIAKLRITPNKRVEMKFLNGDIIKKQILGGEIRIAHAYDKVFENLLVTASSGDLAAFIKKYGAKEEVFDSKYTYTFNKTATE